MGSPVLGKGQNLFLSQLFVGTNSPSITAMVTGVLILVSRRLSNLAQPGYSYDGHVLVYRETVVLSCLCQRDII